MRNSNLRNLVRAAVLAAIAWILMLPIFEIPMAFLAPWLKLDLSTLPVLLAGFGLGPLWAVGVQAVKSLLHIPVGTTGGIGELADFLMGVAMVLPASLIYARERTRKRALIGMAVGVACMMAVGALTNYFIMMPLYFGSDPAAGIAGALAGNAVINDMATYITLAVLPFNLIKGVVIGTVTFLLYKYVRRFLHDSRQP